MNQEIKSSQNLRGKHANVFHGKKGNTNKIFHTFCGEIATPRENKNCLVVIKSYGSVEKIVLII